MRLHATALATTLAILAAGCGGASPEDQVRDTARHIGEAVSGPHPERACRYMTDRDACVGAVAVANSMNLEVSAAIGLPDDWRDRIDKAQVKVSGDTAKFGKATYVRHGDLWLLDNR